MAADDVSSVYFPKVKLNVGASGLDSDFTGTIAAVTNLAAGTLTSVANLAAGTLTRLTAGTITALGAGTVTRGTVQTIGTNIRHVAEFATAVNLTGTATGTVRAAVAGSSIYVTTLVMSVESAGKVSLASGTPTIPLLGSLQFNANGGIALAPVNPPIRTTSGSALVYNQSGTGVISVFASGFIE